MTIRRNGTVKLFLDVYAAKASDSKWGPRVTSLKSTYIGTIMAESRYTLVPALESRLHGIGYKRHGLTLLVFRASN